MSEPAEHPAAPTFRLIYTSHSLIASDARMDVLGEIFTTARRNNAREAITGALVITDGAFAQALEGEESAVRALYERIAHDQRHDHVTLREAGGVEARVFGRWAMAKVAEGGGPDIRLLANADRGRIVAAGPDSHATEAQEAVIASMREALYEAERPSAA